MIDKPDAFLSYTRFDDRKGKITQFCRELSEAVQEISGKPFVIFQDIEGIGLGRRWQDALDEMLDQARFFIPIVTQSFFYSGPCRDELTRFLKIERQAGRQDLVLPIYWVTSPVIEDDHLKADDELAQVIDERQRWDWRELRYEPIEAKEVQRDLSALAFQIERARRHIIHVSAPLPKKPIANEKTHESKKRPAMFKRMEISPKDNAPSPEDRARPSVDDLEIRIFELTDNPSPRLPISLVLDTSYSMNGSPIDNLNEGVRIFFDTVKDDSIAKSIIEVCVVTFGGRVDIQLDYEPVGRQKAPCLIPSGSTPIGQAMEIALDALEERKTEYSCAGVDYFQPWLVLMTDGSPVDKFDEAVRRTESLVRQRALSVFPIAIGNTADVDVLAQFSPMRAPFKLRGLCFQEFFVWLSDAALQASRRFVGDKLNLNQEDIDIWAEIEKYPKQLTRIESPKLSDQR